MSTISPSPATTQNRPRRTRQRLLSAILVLLAVGATTATLHSIGGRNDTTTFTAAGAHELVIDIHAGRVELTPSRDGTVRVTTTRHWSVWAPATGHRQVGGVPTLSGGCPPSGNLGITRCTVEQRVSVPAGTRVRVSASTADLIGTDLAVTSFEAQTSRGSITASFTSPPDRIMTRLDAGSVRLTVPTASYAVHATIPAHAGRVIVDLPNDPAAPHRIAAHSSRGTIQILHR